MVEVSGGKMVHVVTLTLYHRLLGSKYHCTISQTIGFLQYDRAVSYKRNIRTFEHQSDAILTLRLHFVVPHDYVISIFYLKSVMPGSESLAYPSKGFLSLCCFTLITAPRYMAKASRVFFEGLTMYRCVV